MRTLTWSALGSDRVKGSPPPPRILPGMVSSGSKIFVFGGTTYGSDNVGGKLFHIAHEVPVSDDDLRAPSRTLQGRLVRVRSPSDAMERARDSGSGSRTAGRLCCLVLSGANAHLWGNAYCLARKVNPLCSQCTYRFRYHSIFSAFFSHIPSF